MNYFDTFIIDLWGVIHDGKKSFPHALNCLEKIHQNKKNIILISNSSKKNINIISNLKKLGFNTNIFDDLSTGFKENIDKRSNFINGSIFDQKLLKHKPKIQNLAHTL